jgi:hypothetical protein
MCLHGSNYHRNTQRLLDRSPPRGQRAFGSPIIQINTISVSVTYPAVGNHTSVLALPRPWAPQANCIPKNRTFPDGDSDRKNGVGTQDTPLIFQAIICFSQAQSRTVGMGILVERSKQLLHIQPLLVSPSQVALKTQPFRSAPTQPRGSISVSSCQT